MEGRPGKWSQTWSDSSQAPPLAGRAGLEVVPSSAVPNRSARWESANLEGPRHGSPRLTSFSALLCASRKICCCVLFSFISKDFLVSFHFLWLIGYLGSFCLILPCCEFSKLHSIFDIWFYSVVVRKLFYYYFSPFKVIEARFMPWRRVCPGERGVRSRGACSVADGGRGGVLHTRPVSPAAVGLHFFTWSV